jgi:hypothetical protein
MTGLLLVAGVVSFALASVLLSPRSAGAQQGGTALPEEVSTWMARNNVRRWANMIDTGEKLFNEEGTCHFCHSEGGVGGQNGPDLTDDEWVQGDRSGSLEMIYEVVFWGVRRRDFADPNRRFQMNPKGGMELDAGQLDAITAYVWSLSHETQLPQR